MKLGCIGDDFTGSSDLGLTLVKGGMRVTQYAGVPSAPADTSVEAGIVALKSRTAPVAEAVRLSLEALEWLRDQGCTQVVFKYCSTFDSTPKGNIGPVIDALMEALGTDRALVCPAFPATGRGVYQGHLFVNDRLLSESGMENHPLTPMTDPDLRRWLGLQTRHAVGHVAASTVFAGADAIHEALDREVKADRPVIVVDAIRDADLFAIGRAARDVTLITGGSGIALGLPANHLGPGARAREPGWTGDAGPAALLSGSCSNMTRAQVARFAAGNPAREITAEGLTDGSVTAESAAEWALAQDRPALLYSSADPDVVRAAQERFGREAIAGRIERFFADVARALTARGVTRLVVAGGETSGAVVEGLGLEALEIGPEIAPGVPALRATGRGLVLTLKSGNFGDEAFFETALARLAGAS